MKKLSEAAERRLQAKLARVREEGIAGQMDLLDALTPLTERSLGEGTQHDQVVPDDTPTDQ